MLHTRWAFSLLDPEKCSLLVPIFRESFSQFVKRYGLGFAAIEDQIDDVRSKIDQTESPKKKRPVHVLLPGQCTDTFNFARLQVLLELKSLNQRLLQGGEVVFVQRLSAIFVNQQSCLSAVMLQTDRNCYFQSAVG